VKAGCRDILNDEHVAAQAGLSSTWRELLGQRDTVPLAWDCPLEAERRWLAHCRTWQRTREPYHREGGRVAHGTGYGQEIYSHIEALRVAPELDAMALNRAEQE
jgi:hypothetical protein